MNNTKPPVPYRRRKKYVRPDLQAKLILGSLGITLIVTFVGTHIPLIGLWQFTASNQGENNALIQHMSRFFTAAFYVSILLTASLATWFGYWYSFRFCGPIYAMKKYFVEMKTGSWDRDMRLRKKDDLQDVKDAINGGVGEMRTRLEQQYSVLAAAASCLENQNSSPEVRAQVLASCRAELEECATRFPAMAENCEESNSEESPTETTAETTSSTECSDTTDAETSESVNS